MNRVVAVVLRANNESQDLRYATNKQRCASEHRRGRCNDTDNMYRPKMNGPDANEHLQYLDNKGRQSLAHMKEYIGEQGTE